MIPALSPTHTADRQSAATVVAFPERPPGDSTLWRDIVDSLDFALQPIVSIHTGLSLGFEVLLRNTDHAGYTSIQEFFDDAYADRMLYTVDLWLREKAICKFKSLEFHRKCRLFYNIDNRVLLMPDYQPGNTSAMLVRHGLSPSTVCFELSERHQFECFTTIKTMLASYKQQGYRIAVDDFGTGFSGLQMLYHAEPDFIKIDRFFIAGIAADPKKRLFVFKVLSLAHTLGIAVIAEGVESVEEFHVCKDIGCDYVQGYLIQEPQLNCSRLSFKYENVSAFSRTERRLQNSDQRIITDQMEFIVPIRIDRTNMTQIFEEFRRHKAQTFIPVVNEKDEPLGLIMEKDLKEYAYSRYGKDLLLNAGLSKTLPDFISRCPVANVHKSLEEILDIYALDERSEGIILTSGSLYAGFMSAQALLKALNEKNIAIARDQNPLTKLPGNSLITTYIAESFDNLEHDYVYAYFDFDNFKPFNDTYGFRVGDRAILLFADLLKSCANGSSFVGHIGGDDFFSGVQLTEKNRDNILPRIQMLIRRFSEDIRGFYSERERNNGYLTGIDRDGLQRRFPLLSVSAAVLYLSKNRDRLSLEEVGLLIASLKKEAKLSHAGIRCEHI